MTVAHPTLDLSVPAMRVLESLPEDIRAEVIYGKLFILPHPLLYHADLVMQITQELSLHVISKQLGKVYCCPVGVYLLEATNAVIPDIVFISNNNHLTRFESKGIFGPPDLHIEVLSPRNRTHDLIRKKKLYEEAGVKEYWIIDPETKGSTGYQLKEGAYGNPLLMNSKIHIRILDREITF